MKFQERDRDTEREREREQSKRAKKKFTKKKKGNVGKFLFSKSLLMLIEPLVTMLCQTGFLAQFVWLNSRPSVIYRFRVTSIDCWFMVN